MRPDRSGRNLAAATVPRRITLLASCLLCVLGLGTSPASGADRITAKELQAIAKRVIPGANLYFPQLRLSASPARTLHFRPLRISYLILDDDRLELEPLVRAQIEIECAARLAENWDGVVPSLGTTLWSRPLKAARRLVRSGLEELSRGQQPTGAMRDHGAVVLARVQHELFQAVWTWAGKRGFGLQLGPQDGLKPWSPPIPAPRPTLVDLRTLAREYLAKHSPRRARIELASPILEYDVAFPQVLQHEVPGLPEGWRPLFRGVLGLERHRRLTEALATTGGAAVQTFWKPALANADKYVAAAHRVIENRDRVDEASTHRVGILVQLAEATLFDRLWAFAKKRGLVLWPLGAHAPSRDEVETTRVELEDGKFALLVVPARVMFIPVPAVYETVEEQYCVSPERIVKRSGGREEVIPARYETRCKQVCVKPASAREEVLPAQYVTVDVSTDFGELRHVWFLDGFTYEEKKKYRPTPSKAWDASGAEPPHPPWIDLLAEPSPLARRRDPVGEGYVLIVGAKGARGPERVDLGSKKSREWVFSAPTRKLP